MFSSALSELSWVIDLRSPVANVEVEARLFTTSGGSILSDYCFDSSIASLSLESESEPLLSGDTKKTSFYSFNRRK